jgi:hypothetical protein
MPIAVNKPARGLSPRFTLYEQNRGIALLRCTLLVLAAAAEELLYKYNPRLI